MASSPRPSSGSEGSICDTPACVTADARSWLQSEVDTGALDRRVRGAVGGQRVQPRLRVVQRGRGDLGVRARVALGAVGQRPLFDAPQGATPDDDALPFDRDDDTDVVPSGGVEILDVFGRIAFELFGPG